MFKTKDELTSYISTLQTREMKPRIVISRNATCCLLQGSKEVADVFASEMDSRGLSDDFELTLSGCLGFCDIEPVVILEDQNILYQNPEYLLLDQNVMRFYTHF